MANGMDVALPLEEVKEILNAGDFEPVPNAAAHVVGIINIRGEVVPVIGGRIFSLRTDREPIGKPTETAQKNAKIIIIGSGVDMKGLLVDYVYGVSTCTFLHYSEVSSKKLQINQAIISGVVLGESGLELPLTSNEKITFFLKDL